MKTATQILKEKGYELDEINDIVNDLDIKVREEYKVSEQPVHLWEAYYSGDASEDNLNEIAIEQGFENHEELIRKMTSRLNELAEEYSTKDGDKTYKIALVFMNPYIGSRNGGNRIISEGLSIEKAKAELLQLFNENCNDGYAETWEEAKELTKNRILSANGEGENAYFEYDSRRFSIEEEE